MNDRTRDNYDFNQLSHPAQAVEAAPIVALRSVVLRCPWRTQWKRRALSIDRLTVIATGACSIPPGLAPPPFYPIESQCAVAQ
jgi:hypothetical protein